jgi:hypothetical protein
LAEWRKERRAAHQLLNLIEKKIGKEMPICYKECDDDPGIIPIPKEPQFEAWKSFSIIVKEFNYYGFGSEQEWIKYAEKVGEEFYDEYLQTHYEVCSGSGVDEWGPDDPYLHNWTTSGARIKFK